MQSEFIILKPPMMVEIFCILNDYIMMFERQYGSLPYFTRFRITKFWLAETIIEFKESGPNKKILIETI